MTYEEKWKADGHTMPSRGCPCDYDYEEQPKFSRHCARVSCDDCWKREMKEKERDMEYKVGDKVTIVGKVSEVEGEFSNLSYYIELRNGIKKWFSQSAISPYKTYEQGLEDAWELAKKIYVLDCDEVMDIFGVAHGMFGVLDELTVQEALAKLKAYEEAQTIKVGDVVECADCLATVLDILEEECFVITENGCVESWRMKGCKKTGKHVDIAGLLEQIRQ